MGDTPNINPTGPQGPKPASESDQTQQKSSGSGWNPKPLTWLGMHFTAEETKQLWNIISQNIGYQIAQDKAKALKALKKLGEDDGGESDSD